MADGRVSWQVWFGLIVLILGGWLVYDVSSTGTEISTAPQVTAVYPSSAELPANLLRLYIQFSEPMKTVGNLEQIKLLDQSGGKVPYVFFNNASELWNHEQTQLTLIVDPARVKTGLVAHETLGRALVPGETYTLVIAGLQDVSHEEMDVAYKKVFTVAEADLTFPDMDRWHLTAPVANTAEPFRIEFPGPLDFQSLQQRIVITDDENTAVAGQVTIEDQETTWYFSPDKPWQKGDYRLQVNSRLEDSAGNNLNGLFDHATDALLYDREGVTEFIPFRIE